MINKVSKKECLKAIDYFWKSDYLSELTSDKRYFCEILLKKVANDYNIKLANDNHKCTHNKHVGVCDDCMVDDGPFKMVE